MRGQVAEVQLPMNPDFEKKAKAKEEITFAEIPWASVPLFKERLRQTAREAAGALAGKVAKEWSRRWHPDKW